jgi:hypothetical protein
VRREVLYNGVWGTHEISQANTNVFNETYRKVRIGKHLSDNFPIQNGLKQGDALSPLLFNFALEYAIRKVQENQFRLKLNETHQLLAYADNVNLLGCYKENTETLIDAGREVDRSRKSRIRPWGYAALTT